MSRGLRVGIRIQEAKGPRQRAFFVVVPVALRVAFELAFARRRGNLSYRYGSLAVMGRWLGFPP